MNIIKKERLIALALVFAMLITVYIVALYKLQIIEGEKYYEESRNNMVTTSTVTAARGINRWCVFFACIKSLNRIDDFRRPLQKNFRFPRFGQ